MLGDAATLYARAEAVMMEIRALLESGQLHQAPDDLLDRLARTVGDLARLRSGSETDVRAAVFEAEQALALAKDWLAAQG
jgi:hypothetical protein